MHRVDPLPRVWAYMATWTIRRDRFFPPRPYKARLETVDQLRDWLNHLLRERDSSFTLRNEETRDELWVGMDAPYATVSFIRGSDGASFSASTDLNFRPASQGDYLELDTFQDEEKVPRDQCLSFEAMTRIVEHVFANHALPGWISWRQTREVL